MADTLLPDDPKTVERLDSVACLFEWLRSMSGPDRKRFSCALAECSDAVQEVVIRLLGVVKSPRTTAVERQRALMTIADALFPNSASGEYGLDLIASEANAAAESVPLAREVRKMDTQEATFADRVRELMETRRISQQELASRAGCSQPAISQMLNRTCRPQKKTIVKLAEALNVQASDLWPDIEMAEMLDAVASFQQDDYVMTEAEARALGNTSQPNRPKIQAKAIPTRHRQ
ncbi:MAG: helix-turn-helix transcriptional regulator [Thermoguttaceae bacterium]|nr:helix-turn-helix transcriptional regulator [Thermoguttaceae bacterium]